MSPPIVFGDIRLALLDLLRDDWPDLECGTIVPKDIPDPYARLLLTGGPGMVTRVSERTQVSVDVWASTTFAAAKTAQEVRASLLAAAGRCDDLTVYRVDEVSAPAELADPLTPQLARFTFSIQAHVRGVTQ